MKRRITSGIILALVLVLLVGSVSAAAYSPYDTYTYSIDGLPLQSPDAYTVYKSFNSFDMKLSEQRFGGKILSNPKDVVTDSDANVYISDSGNNRVVVLDKYFSAKATISEYVDEYGKHQTFNDPQGVFVTDANKTADHSSYIYICDTGNKRIVIFDRSYNYVRTINCPTNSSLLKEINFTPNAIAVDIYGRLFVISETSNEGIIVLSSQGDFTGYIGAQKVSYSIFDMIWRRFKTDEQKQQEVSATADAYNNITVDDDGFVYVTTDDIIAEQQFKAIKSKSADYSPVKKFNSTGVEIMKRNGFFDPGGEVDVFYSKDVSKITDVALGAEGSWTILDSSRQRFFTYDQNGNLLFAFGDSGDQLGNGTDIKSITYQVFENEDGTYTYYLLALDRTDTGYQVTVYSPTDYCDTLMSALRNQNEHNYSASIEFWREVLTSNTNFDLAYIGIGKALFSQGKYEEAMEQLENAFETKYASDAFAEIRKGFINKYILLIIIGAVALIVGLVKFLGYAKRKNKETSLKVGQKTYWEELLFSFHLVFHPFDGFWDLKHERRGSVRAATTILAITVVAFFYNSIGKGYLFNPEGNYTNIFGSILSIVLPVLLWAISNWCLTTLFDGEGSFKDIYIATCYSLAPLPLFVIVSTVLTNVMTTTEGSMVDLLIVFGFIWTAILLFFGMLVTHDYSMNKNFITVLGTILAMAIIIFVALLFSTLVMRMVTFVVSLYKEIANRI